MPGSPCTATEFARPVNPPDARSSQSPSGSLTIAGHPREVMRDSSSALKDDAGRVRRGRSGTTFQVTTSASGTRASAPSRRSMHASSSVTSTSRPTTSVMAGPPLGPRPATTCRTTTR